MDEIWFSNSSPVHGMKIFEWACDADGRNIDPVMYKTASRSVDRPEYSPAIHPLSFKDRSQHSQSSESNRSGNLSHIVPGLDTQRASGDGEMVLRLESLIRDAKDAFQSVLSHNSNLERELEDIRVSRLSSPPISAGRRMSASSTATDRPLARKSPAPRLPVNLSREYEGRHVFDISTPPTGRSKTETPAKLRNLPVSLNGLLQPPVPINPGRIRTRS